MKLGTHLYGLIIILCIAACTSEPADELTPEENTSASNLAKAGHTAENDTVIDWSKTHLRTHATWEIGAGYTYDATLDYGKGMGYQIFDIVNMDKKQIENGQLYVTDDINPTSSQSIITAHTHQDLYTNIAVAGAVGIPVYGVMITVYGSYSQEDLQSRDYEYGMYKINNTVFTRDIQYMNVVRDADKGVKGLFTPAFESDRDRLQAFNSKDDPGDSLTYYIHDFLQRWGLCFMSRSELGGSLEYTIQIEKTVLSSTLSVGAAVEASFMDCIGVKVGADFTNKMTKIRDHYSYSLSAYGGNVQILQGFLGGGEYSAENYKAWTKSVKWSTDLKKSNCVIVNFQLVGMAQLFTGKVKDRMQAAIDAWTN